LAEFLTLRLNIAASLGQSGSLEFRRHSPENISPPEKCRNHDGTPAARPSNRDGDKEW